jgi:hypothetical protein
LPPGNLAAFAAAFAQWLRNGKPMPSPQSTDFCLMLSDDGVMDAVIRIEHAFREETGLSCWRFYDPAYYDPMMETRRQAHAAGEDPDTAAAVFHEKWLAAG